MNTVRLAGWRSPFSRTASGSGSALVGAPVTLGVRVLATGVALLVLLIGVARAEDFPTPDVAVAALDAEHRELATILTRVARQDGVDYGALRADTAALDRYRTQLARSSVPEGREARMAHYINAYNAWTLALVSRGLPDQSDVWESWSIRSLGGMFSNVWKSYTFELGGSRVTLDRLEHGMLRPMGDPRIHFAINCASRSCPTLASAPFLEKTIGGQLESAAAAFLADPTQIRLVSGRVLINPILKWFSGDFDSVGGVKSFLLKRLTGDLRARIEATPNLEYFDYEWSLNLARKTPPGPSPSPR